MKNKKIIKISIVLVVLAIVFYGVWKWIVTEKISTYDSNPVEYKETSVENKKEIDGWQKYENELYNYQLSYPDNWHIFDDEANASFSEIKLTEDAIVKQGGVVFWSNKESIDYTEENKPEDFLLLGLIIYEKAGTSLEDFAKLLGFNEKVGSNDILFKAKNIVGKEYVSMGATEENPRIAIIFQEESVFYVFHLGFVGDNMENLKTMEGIVGVFGLNKI